VTELEATHDGEPHSGGLANRLNWLRAGVLGANDGIVSVGRLPLEWPARRPRSSRSSLHPLRAWCGAISMALGEYVSVSSQRDSEHALITKEKTELATMPHEELAELTKLYQDKGLSPQTARQVAEELTANDALAAHLDAELNIDQNDIVSPWRAAYASAVAFLIGGLLPILAIIFFPASMRVPATFAAVLIALAITGAIGGYLGDSPMLRPMVRVVIGGALAATFLIGRLLGTTVLA
jgi:VIT1/CCC1 family predicted Fe2+/Mn2+ transporter